MQTKIHGATIKGMINLRVHIVALVSLLSLSAPAKAAALYQNVFIDRSDIVYPIPADNDVIKTLGKASRTQLPSRKLKFLVWNLYKGAKDTFSIEYMSLGFDRDIIMNQEVFLDKNMLGTFKFMPHFMFTTATSFFSGKEKIRTGVANISTVKPVFTDFLRTEVLEPVVNSPKVLLINSYPIRFSNKKLTVVNIHGINFVTNKNFRFELNRIYEKIKDIPAPLVFAGDFNTWNEERIALLSEYAKKLNLLEAKFFPDNRMSFNGHPLDHFLHTPDLKVINARVDGFYQGSDHKPLQVELEFLNQTINSSDSETDQYDQDSLTSY